MDESGFESCGLWTRGNWDGGRERWSTRLVVRLVNRGSMDIDWAAFG